MSGIAIWRYGAISLDKETWLTKNHIVRWVSGRAVRNNEYLSPIVCAQHFRAIFPTTMISIIHAHNTVVLNHDIITRANEKWHKNIGKPFHRKAHFSSSGNFHVQIKDRSGFVTDFGHLFILNIKIFNALFLPSEAHNSNFTALCSEANILIS